MLNRISHQRAFGNLAGAAVLATCFISCGGGGYQPRSVELQPPEQNPAAYGLTRDGKVLTGPRGRSLRVKRRSVRGYIDAVSLNGGVVHISGWAATPDLTQPASSVIAFAGDKGIASITPSIERPDVVESLDAPALASSGYSLSIPKVSLNCSQPVAGLTILGTAEEIVGPLTWVAGTNKRLVADACRPSRSPQP